MPKLVKYFSFEALKDAPILLPLSADEQELLTVQTEQAAIILHQLRLKKLKNATK